MRGRETMKMALALAVAVLSFGALASTALAGEAITEYEVGSTNQAAGGHPDLTARLKLADPGEPEVAKNLTINLPEGIFGNPGSIFKCRAAVFVVNHCQAGAQLGVITIVANYEGNVTNVLGTAPLYNMETIGEDEAARIAFVVPTINIPVVIPIQVRSDSDYGLRLSINSISQTLALTSATMTVWGFPASSTHDVERFFAGEPGEPPGCPARPRPTA